MTGRIPERTRRMYDIYSAGATLEDVGDAFGLTRERIRQLFQAAGLHIRSNAETAALRRESLARQEAEIARLFRDSGDVKSVARDLDLDPSYVDGVVKRKVPAHWRFKDRAASLMLYSDEELLRCLATAQTELGGILSVADYKRLSKGRKLSRRRPWPTNQTFQNRFGSWRAALDLAGLRANPATPIAGKRIFEIAHCIDAVREVARAMGRVPTAAEYEDYARGMNGALPSLATLRHRCGTWLNALRLAKL